MSKVYAKKSQIAGMGLFAKKDIKKGEIAFIMKGKTIKANKNNREDILAEPNVMGIDKNTWIFPYVPYIYTNHSCNPNLSVKGRITFVALRNIKKNEELTFDYSISEYTSWTPKERSWSMKCSCGSTDCRKVIWGTKYLPISFFKKYFPIFPTYFKNFYLEQHKELIEIKNK